MTTSTKVTFRMEKDVKEQFEKVLNELGMNLTTGINVFAKAVIRNGGIPFDLYQAYRNPYNMDRIMKSRDEAANGNLIYKTAEDLGLDDE